HGDDVAPEVAVDEAGEEPDKHGAHQHPPKKEMDDPARPEVLIGRDGRPCGEASYPLLAIGAGIAEQARGFERVAEDRRVAADRTVGLVAGIDREDRIGEFEARLLADIKAGM